MVWHVALIPLRWTNKRKVDDLFKAVGNPGWLQAALVYSGKCVIPGWPQLVFININKAEYNEGIAAVCNYLYRMLDNSWMMTWFHINLRHLQKLILARRDYVSHNAQVNVTVDFKYITRRPNSRCVWCRLQWTVWCQLTVWVWSVALCSEAL